MSLSLVQSRALLGLDAAAVTVEVHLANGLPSFTLVGLADVEVKEARERVRSAIQNSGLVFWPPAGRSTHRAWQATSLQGNCLCQASCARCVARWPWRWRCTPPKW